MIRYFTSAFLLVASIPNVVCVDYVFIHGDGYEGCIEPQGGELDSGNSVVLGDCSNDLTAWRIEQKDSGTVRLHARSDDSVCLQATHTGDLMDGARLRVYPCSDSVLLDFVNGDDGYIRPASRPDLCVVYEGVTVDVGEDDIILKDCETVMMQAEKGTQKKWTFEPVIVGEEDVEKTIFLHPDDRRVLSVMDSEGGELTFFATKDAEGLASSIDEFTSLKDEKKIVVGFDASGRPTRILAEDGSRIEIEWPSDTVMVVSYTTTDGAGQVITEIDLESLGTEQGGGRKLRQTSKANGHSHPMVAGSLRRRLQPPAFDIGTGSTTIELLRCNTEPVTDAVVELRVNLKSATGEFRNDTYLAQHIGNGVYAADFVLGGSLGTEDQPLQDACESLATALGVVCTGAGVIPAGNEILICLSISSLFAVFAPEAFIACEAAFAATRVACLTAGASPVPGAPDIITNLCAVGSSLSTPTAILAEQVTLLPIVLSPSGVSIDPQTVPVSGPYPNFSSNVGGNEPEIVSFTINPADPAPSEDYVGTAEVTCAIDSIGLTIIGTDDYEDEVVCDVFEGGASTECGFLVPGADAGISDRVTLFIDGEPSRVIDIVF